MRGLKFQFSSALLMILTVAAVVCAVINFQQQQKFELLPDDGVTWVDRTQGVTALDVQSRSPGSRAGIREGDVLLQINGLQVEKAIEVSQILVGVKAYYKARYLVRRQGIEVTINSVLVGETPRDAYLYYQYVIGLAYLGIGLFVLFRRGIADKAQHFYVLCLASFIFTTFHYTGKLNSFDKLMYFGNVAGGLFAPTIFLHFCLTFPEPRAWLRRRGASVLLYLPALFLLSAYWAATSGTLRIALSPIELRWMLDRMWLLFLTGMYLAGGMVLTFEYRKTRDLIVRQQLKWLRNGAILGVVPFALFYVLPYTLGYIPGEYLKISVLSLILIPLTWSYAIIRYRLMDVDVIFQQGYVYTLATVCVLAIFYGIIFSVGTFDNLSPTAAAALILIAAFMFQPIRNWLQEQLDRYFFYKDRYDYRLTLIEFARELSSETDLDAMLPSVGDRLIHTLSLKRLAFFLADEATGRFYLKEAVAASERGGVQPEPRETDLDLSFLSADSGKPYYFFEQTRHPLDVLSRNWPPSVRQTIARLNFTYYLPCTVRGRTIAYLGVSRTDKGDFLTSDDLDLLTTVAGYVGIAIENARLYRSLEHKVEEYERLKEYSENIVESINVGILAADLEDRVESWNSQIESLTGVLREDAVGRKLSDLFPAELMEQIDAARGDTGIRHIYKFALRQDASPKVIEFPSNGPNGNVAKQENGNGAAPHVHEIILNIAIAPLVSRELEQIGRLIIFDDVTDRDELERRLVQADKLSSIGLLAAGVAHEVNTPLAVISTYAQMLTKQVAGDDQKSRLLDKIAKQTFRASEIVNSLLNFSRTSPTAFDDLDLNRVIHECLPMIEHQMEKTGIRIQLDLEDGLPLVKGNSGKLQQVFLNLFLNARDAMASGGTLRISSRNQGEAVAIDVIDTGHGIQPENLHRIFDPFFTTKAVRKGTGLGLSVTYGIVREHGGVIAVESQPGQGTRFHLEFPLVRKAVHA
jgi:two-component system, NtrC family, sensor kinase